MALWDFLDYFKKNRVKSNIELTLEKQKETASNYTYVFETNPKTKKKKKPIVEILFTERHKIDELKDLITNYYMMGFRLAGGISMHGSSLSVILIKE